jgi:hypothetical protein
MVQLKLNLMSNVMAKPKLNLMVKIWINLVVKHSGYHKKKY